MPELVYHLHALLWSINERQAGKPGLDIPMLSDEWEHDLVEFEIAANDELEEWREKMREGDKF